MSEFIWSEIPESEKIKWCSTHDRVWRLGKVGEYKAAVIAINGSPRFRPMRYFYEDGIPLIAYFKKGEKIDDTVFETLVQAQEFIEGKIKNGEI